jgi:hypothetical protein
MCDHYNASITVDKTKYFTNMLWNEGHNITIDNEPFENVSESEYLRTTVTVKNYVQNESEV